VLCSRGRGSSTLIFWGRSAKSVPEIAKAADIGFLQRSGDRVEFSRYIAVADGNRILECFGGDAGRKLPAIRHHGIEDASVENFSSLPYYRRGRWVELQGADIAGRPDVLKETFRRK
jgi:hypothetical protein